MGQQGRLSSRIQTHQDHLDILIIRFYLHSKVGSSGFCTLCLNVLNKLTKLKTERIMIPQMFDLPEVMWSCELGPSDHLSTFLFLNLFFPPTLFCFSFSCAFSPLLDSPFVFLLFYSSFPSCPSVTLRSERSHLFNRKSPVFPYVLSIIHRISESESRI